MARRLLGWLGRLVVLPNRLLNLIYPDLCVVCGSELIDGEHGFCTSCAYHLPRILYDSFVDNPACDKLAGKVRFDRAAAYLLYEKESPVQVLFEQFKYHGNRSIAKQLGVMAGQSFVARGFFEGIDVMVPVPLHPDKLRLRGYNQSELIAKGLSVATGLPVDTTSLRRTIATETQTRKHYWARQQNVEDAFDLTDDGRQNLTGKHVLIVDDVLTTGATMAACAHALYPASPSNISFLALAMA